MPVQIFFCYAHEDEELLNKLKRHLWPLQRQGLIDVWHDRDISAGSEWEDEISQHLNAAHMILLLISPDFMYSDYCYGIEMKRSLERNDRREARVIPIIVRPVYWQGVLGKLQALPTDAKPIMSSSWQYPDEAYFNVTVGIRKAVEELMTSPKTSPEIKESLVIVPPQAGLQIPMQDNPPKQVQKTKELWLEEGNRLLDLKQYSEALAAYEQACRLDPNYAFAYNGKVLALTGLNREKEAQQAYEKARQLGYSG